MSEVVWIKVLLPMLVVVIAGLVTAEGVLRWCRAAVLAEKLFERYVILVAVVWIGGVITGLLLGGLLAASLVANGALGVSPLPLPLAALVLCLVGAAHGLVLGLAEGLVLALPLAMILGRFRPAS